MSSDSRSVRALYEVTGHEKNLPRAHDIASLPHGPFNPIDSSDNGEIGTVTVISPIRDDVDICGDIVSFVQSMMDVLDEAATIDDIYDMFLEAIDGDNVTDTLPAGYM
jgi:hypothetical protein